MSNFDTAKYPIQRIVPTPDGLQLDQETAQHMASRKYEDLKVLIRRVPPWPLPPKEPKVQTDFTLMERVPYAANSAMMEFREFAMREPRGRDTRRQHQSTMSDRPGTWQKQFQ
jgi:hypothetical protein